MGIVLVNAMMSLDGFIAGPNDEMDWVFEYPVAPNAPDEAASPDLADGALEQEDSASARDRGPRSDQTIAAHRPMPACAYAFS